MRKCETCNIFFSKVKINYNQKIYYLVAIGLSSLWSEWACLDQTDSEYNSARKRTQRVRYKSCTNPSEYDGGAYCGSNVDIRAVETSATDAAYPLCYNGVWFCSKEASSDTTGTLGDGSTQGSCISGKTCFSGPVDSEDSNGCRGTD